MSSEIHAQNWYILIHPSTLSFLCIYILWVSRPGEFALRHQKLTRLIPLLGKRSNLSVCSPNISLLGASPLAARICWKQKECRIFHRGMHAVSVTVGGEWVWGEVRWGECPCDTIHPFLPYRSLSFNIAGVFRTWVCWLAWRLLTPSVLLSSSPVCTR